MVKWIPLLALGFLPGEGETTESRRPVLFFSDLESGPNVGGENNKGAFVTLWGHGLGDARGNSTVTVGGGVVESYPLWTDTHVTVQLGLRAATGMIVVHLDGGHSSNGIPFVVRPATIHFVSASGDDGSDGTRATPWRTLVKARRSMSPGSITYAMSGVCQTEIDKFSASLVIESAGTAESPIALVAYPGAKVTVGSPTGADLGLFIRPLSGTCDFGVVSGFILRGKTSALQANGVKHWRFVGNDISCPQGDGATGSVMFVYSPQYLQFYGNEVHHCSVDNAAAVGKLYHPIYVGTDATNIDIGWNRIHDNKADGAILFHSTGGSDLFDLAVHDNEIHDNPGYGIAFAQIDPSKGAVRVYNNLIYRVGQGPFPGGATNYAAIDVTGHAMGRGDVYVYNNTFYDCGVEGGGNAGTFLNGGHNPNIRLVLRNNIVFSVRGERYFAPTCKTSLVNGTNNLFFGCGPGPEFLTKNLNADPLFVDPERMNFRLRPGSPAIGAGKDGPDIRNDIDGIPRPKGSNPSLGAHEVYGR